MHEQELETLRQEHAHTLAGRDQASQEQETALASLQHDLELRRAEADTMLSKFASAKEELRKQGSKNFQSLADLEAAQSLAKELQVALSKNQAEKESLAADSARLKQAAVSWQTEVEDLEAKLSAQQRGRQR